MFAYPIYASETPILESYSSQFIREMPLQAPKSSRIECNCVAWAKWYLGRQDESWGYPEDILVKSEGDVVVTKEGEFGHVAVIDSLSSTSLNLIEANWIPCKVSTRSLSLDDPRIRGYY